MRKEVILAIIIGVILGAIILYGLKIANQSALENQATNSASLKNASPTVTPIPSQPITIKIDSPSDHSVSFTPTINLKGQTQPSTNVAITSDSGDTIVTSDTAGYFSSSVTLIGGENTITATSIFSNNSTASASISIIYTTSQLDN